MSNTPQIGMTVRQALRLELFIIGLGLFALVLIFQPFSIGLFAIGCMLVVLAGLMNNLLPLARPGVKVKSVITIAMVIAMIFCIVLLVSIWAAYLYASSFWHRPIPIPPQAKPCWPQRLSIFILSYGRWQLSLPRWLF